MPNKNVLLEVLVKKDALKYFCLDEEYDKVVNLINRKPITAVQWLEYNKRKIKNKLDRLKNR